MHFRIIVIALLCTTAALHADVLVSTTLNMTQLVVTPSSGTFQLISPFATGAFAQAQDSLGGLVQQLINLDDVDAAATANTTLASASGNASASFVTLGSFSGVNIVGITASASSVGQGALGPAFGVGQGLFQISDPGNPGQNEVSVTFSATLDINQLLQTDNNGAGTSEVIFSLLLPDFPDTALPLLFFDNPLCAGISIGCSTPSPASLAFTSTPTLTESISLKTNTQYTLIAQVDSESRGLNVVPEPASLIMLGTAVSVLFAGRRWRGNHFRP